MNILTRKTYDQIHVNVIVSQLSCQMKRFFCLLHSMSAAVMTKDVRCVTPETDMETLTNLMVDEHLKTVPVVEKKKSGNPDIDAPARLVGIITRHDILGAIAATEAEELLKNREQEKE